MKYKTDNFGKFEFRTEYYFQNLVKIRKRGYINEKVGERVPPSNKKWGALPPNIPLDTMVYKNNKTI